MASVTVLAVTVSDTTFFHAVEPPETVCVGGGVRSIMVAPPAQAETLPAPSMARNRRLTLPSVAIVSDAPDTGADQVAPWSVEVSYWYPAMPEPPASVEFEAV